MHILQAQVLHVSPLDVSYTSVVVKDGAATWDRERRSDTLRLHQIPDHYLREEYKGRKFDSIDSDYSLISRYTREAIIAVTPRQRFRSVAAGKDSSRDWMPYSLREGYNNFPLPDFDQAAHDARRMGWLLQDPNDPCNLVLPTTWHRDYLKSLLEPTEIPPPDDLSFDDFLCKAIGLFSASTLAGYVKQRKSLLEAHYDSEFQAAVRSFCGPLFLIPQCRTASGAGTVDFTCISRKWAIEFMRDGDRMHKHLARFGPEGAYGREWPTWDWRVVDFYYHYIDQPIPSPGKLASSFYRIFLIF